MTTPGPPDEPSPYPPYEAYPAGQPLYGPPQPGQYGAYGPAQPTAPEHPQATTAFVLGLVALIGGFFCALPLFVGPFAWVTGARARREIDQAPYRHSGRDRATAGMVMGMVATGLLILAVLVIGLAILVIGLSFSTLSTD